MQVEASSDQILDRSLAWTRNREVVCSGGHSQVWLTQQRLVALWLECHCIAEGNDYSSCFANETDSFVSVDAKYGTVREELLRHE